MLKELQVKNFALIDDVSVKFGKGLNVLTGETGAGKTLMIEAINLLLGERADSELIRDGEDKLIVQGYLDLRKSESAFQFLKNENLIDEGESTSDVVITREVNKEGRNRSFINGIFTQVSTLKNLGKYFLDLHGQHDHQYLLDTQTHIDIIDGFGKSEIRDIKNNYMNSFNNYQDIIKEYSKLLKLKNDKEARLEDLRYRLAEFEKLDLKENEEEDLNNERNVLKNYEKIYHICQNLLEIFNGKENDLNSLIDSFSIISKNIRDLSEIDKKFEKYASECLNINIFLTEINNRLKNYTENLHFSQERLDKIQERLFNISEIKRKYNMDISRLKKHSESIKQEISSLESLDFEMENKKSQLNAAKENLSGNALSLSNARIKTIKILEDEVRYELSDLNFKAVKFTIRNEYLAAAGENGSNSIMLEGKKIKVSQNGIDNIEFLISLNPGESVKPLRKIASGGEISRIMLALKSIISGVDNISTMVFDEIDSGIGGATGITVGKKLFDISNSCQIICITHLPQIASFSDNHYYIDKIVERGRTKIKIDKLDEVQKIKELSRMLGGLAESTISIKHAEELLEQTNRIKREQIEEKLKIGN